MNVATGRRLLIALLIVTTIAVSAATWLVTKTRHSKAAIATNLVDPNSTVNERLGNDDAGVTGLQITNQASSTLTGESATIPSVSLSDFEASETDDTAKTIDNTILHRTTSPALSPEQVRQEMLAELSTLDIAVQSRTRHIYRLRDLLRMDDSLPGQLVQQMATQSMSDHTRADLYLALELADTSAAQSALTSIITSADWSVKDGARAIIALGDVSNPEPASINALWETATTADEQLASTALFALGSLGNTLNSANDESYPALRDGLLGYAYGSQEPQLKADYISALGNTRDSALADDLVSLLDDTNPIVRRATAQALGQVGTADSTTSLTDTLKRESSGTVRAAIVETLTDLPDSDEGVIQIIVSMIQNETEEQVRFAMAGYLEIFVAPHDRYQPVLQTLIRQEPSKRVRQRLGEALASMGIR